MQKFVWQTIMKWTVIKTVEYTTSFNPLPQMLLFRSLYHVLFLYYHFFKFSIKKIWLDSFENSLEKGEFARQEQMLHFSSDGTRLVYQHVQTCEQRPPTGTEKMQSLLRGGLCSEVNLYLNWPFGDLETWSLLRGGLYSKLVF